MSKIVNRNVLITGGASGIGKLMGRRFLEEGARNVVIWDVNEDALYKTAAEWQAEGYSNVLAYVVDVTDTENVEDTAIDVLSELGGIDILVNNAGVVVGKNFEDHSASDIDLTVDVNIKAVMHVTLGILPSMIKRGRGHIVNIASAAGLIPNPKMSVYAGSKWAVVGWSESLRLEMEAKYHHINVTTVTPGYIDTGMFEGVTSPTLMPMLKPTEIVNKIILAIKRNEIQLRAPWSVYLAPFLRGILPTRVFDYVVGDLLGVYESMSTFSGKKERDVKKMV
ncbi:MAG: SDR family oxidoreductase [Bacteroidia bacterium]